MSFARVPGQVLIGYASDRVGPRKMILGVAGISALSVYAGWGSATNTGGLLAFALVFGGFAGR
jgi:MFS family permease